MLYSDGTDEGQIQDIDKTDAMMRADVYRVLLKNREKIESIDMPQEKEYRGKYSYQNI